MSKLKHFIFSIFAFLMLANVTVFGQVTTGSLQGIVTDPNGAVVAGAAVKVTNTATGITREVTTNDDGFYRVTNLLPGETYKVEISAQGFANLTLENVVVRLATENAANATLGLQGANVVVDVTSEGEILQTTQNQLKTDFTPKQITQLPNLGGSIDNYALLVPGVAPVGDTDYANGTGITANGNRGRSNNFQIDGQDNNDSSVSGPSLTLTNTEAVGEYQVITNNFSAEFGRNSGAQINTITKAGTNEFNGSFFVYHQNSATDAINNTQKQNGRNLRFLADNGFSEFRGLADRNGKDPFRVSNVGLAVGGPIVRNKAFFFATYQGTFTGGEAVTSNLTTNQVIFDRASSLLARQLFSNASTAQLVSPQIGGGPAFVEGVGQFFIAPPTIDINGDGVIDTFVFGPGNPYGAPVTPNRLSPSLFVCAINPGAGNPCPAASLRTLYTGEVVRLVPTNSRANEFITRIDYNVTSNDLITGRYIFNDTNLPIAIGRFAAGALFDVPSRNHNLGISYTRTLSSNWVNEARFNYSNLSVNFGDTSQLPLPQVTVTGTRDLQSNLSLAYGAQNTYPQSRNVVVYQQQDTVSGTIGNHAVKFGLNFSQQRTNNFFLPDFIGRYAFNNSGTVPENTFYDETGASRAGQTALGFENVLLNRPRDINFAVGSPTRKINQDDYAFFVQDDWRVRPNLTLNLGLRYEISTQPFNQLIEDVTRRESDASTALFDTSFPLSTRTLSTIPIDKNNFAPRVGFAYSPNLNFLGDRFTNGRTVLRGGIGVSYDPSYFNIVNNTVTAAPFAGVGFIRQTPGAAGSVGIPFLPSTTAQLNQTPGTNGGDPRLFNQTRVADDFHNPYTISYNFGIQQELWKNTALEVRYVGSLIRDQFQTINANPDLRALAVAGQYLFGNPTRFTNGVAVTPYTGAGGVAIVPGNTVANFNTRGLSVGSRISGSGRLDPNFGPVRLRNNGANSDYHGLQTEFRTRFSNLALNANYTFSKTTDNASEIFGSFGGGQSIATSQNPFDTTEGERGVSAFHQKHRFSANFVYDLPFFKEQRGFVGKALGGFQISGIVQANSGRPFTPLNFLGNYDVSFDAAFNSTVGTLRPYNGNPNAADSTIAFGYGAACLALYGGPYCDYNGGSLSPGGFVVFDTRQSGSNGTVVANGAAAVQQARLIYNDFGLFANGFLGVADAEGFNYFKTPYGIGRNTFFSGNTFRADLAILKSTKITEGTAIEFRVEATNLFNSRNFGVPDVITEDAATAFSVSTYQNAGFNFGSARSVRFGLRFLF